MIWWRIVLSLLGGYLLGSVSAAVLITRHLPGGDVRKQGSGNAGATNVARVYGIWVGLATLVGDGVKTALAMLLGWWLAGSPGMTAAAFACLLGHCFWTGAFSSSWWRCFSSPSCWQSGSPCAPWRLPWPIPSAC